jgi:hypothetical protein
VHEDVEKKGQEENLFDAVVTVQKLNKELCLAELEYNFI